MNTTNIIAQLGGLSYLGIFIVALLANMVIPVPEEIILLALGYLTGTGSVRLYFVIPIMIAGLLISDIVIYTLARRGNRLMIKIYDRFFARKSLFSNRQWVETHLHRIIFFSRFLIQLRFIGPFLAGRKDLPAKSFIAYDLSALVLYVPLYTMLGFYFQNRVRRIIDDVGVVRNAVIIIALCALCYGIARFFYRMLRRHIINRD